MSYQTPAINNQRQLREQLEDQRRRQRDTEEGDVLIEFPRRLYLRSAGGISYQVSITDDGYVTLTDAAGVSRIMNQGVPGTPGLPGAPGSTIVVEAAGGPGGATISTRIAGEALSGHRAVYVGDDNLLYYAQPNGLAARTVGVTTGAAAAGAAATFQIDSEMVELSWNWVGGSIWLAANGVLTQVVPTVGALFQVGTAMGPDRLRVEPELVAIL